MFVGLSLLLLVGPALDQFLPQYASGAIAAGCLSGTLLLGIWSFVGSATVFRIGHVLAAVATGSVVVDLVSGRYDLNSLTLVVLFVFLAISMWHAARDVAFGGEVDGNRLIGAMCIYEMLGLMWAVMYAGLARSSLAKFAGDALDATAPFWDFVYYSFVTLTTLGYGDVSPVGPVAKSLAYMESVVGQFYIAILVASLVGAHLAGHQPNTLREGGHDA